MIGGLAIDLDQSQIFVRRGSAVNNYLLKLSQMEAIQKDINKMDLGWSGEESEVAEFRSFSHVRGHVQKYLVLYTDT